MAALTDIENPVPNASSRALFMQGLNSILSGNFDIPSEEARSATATASFVIACSQDLDKCRTITIFAEELEKELQGCFCSKQSLRVKKEKMWGLYHRLGTSKKFKDGWNSFLFKLTGQQASLAFYQYVTNEVFKCLIEKEYPLPETSTSTESPVAPLTFEEQNALRYVAGYICRKARERLESSSLPKKNDMILCLIELSGDELFEERGTELWTNTVDRGGLWHISDQTYGVFVIMEEIIRRHLSLAGVATPTENARQVLVDVIRKNEDLLFEWDMLSAEVEEEVSVAVLHKIIDLYVTVRGFGFATSCLEIYKQAHQTTLQKKKALRRELCEHN